MKQLWQIVEKLAEQVDSLPEGRSFAVEELQTLTSGLQKAAALGNWELVAEKLADVAEGPQASGVKELMAHVD